VSRSASRSTTTTYKSDAHPLNTAITNGPISLPMLDTAYLGHIIVLWSWALNSPTPRPPSPPLSASAPWTDATAKSPSPV
jgi:hypothetical protein